MEWPARGITITTGGSSLIAEFIMDGATSKRVSSRGFAAEAKRRNLAEG